MEKGKGKGVSVQEGHIVVKNKKFKIFDIVVFLVCVIIALFIWIHATNSEKRETQKLENLQGEVKTIEQA